MEREIKFEVAMQTKEGYIMCLECDYNWSSGTIYFIRDKDGVHAWHCNSVNIKDSNVLGLREYTGLKDCDGKEIYTGDICYKEGYGRNCVIRRNNERLKFEAFYGVGTGGGEITIGLGYRHEHFCPKCLGVNEEQTESIFGNTVKVIGNIYQNPDLLLKSEDE